MTNLLFICLLLPISLSYIDYNNQDSWPGSCNQGHLQSPIDIQTKDLIVCPSGTTLKTTLLNSKYIQRSIIAGDQNLKQNFISNSELMFTHDGSQTRFNSQQFHLHRGSEHRIDGKAYDVEIHIVHVNQRGDKYAVFAYLFQIDQQMIQNDPIEQMQIDRHLSHISVFPLLQSQPEKIYHYFGSLTTPFCDETVEWFINTQIIPIKAKSYKLLDSLINNGKTSNRASQPLNGRKVELIGNYCDDKIKQN